MTQEQKQLLIKDLCGRLPYGVNLHIEFYDLQGDGKLASRDVKLTAGNIGYCFDNSHWVDIKPYLRPMSSMTKKEKNRYDILVEETVYRPGVLTCSSLINFCHEHHLDNLGLIEKGLALEAPEEMYKN